jgi:phage-related minor tail protein
MSDKNLALKILIEAKDNTAAVFSKLKSSLGGLVGVAAGVAVGAFTALFAKSAEDAELLNVQMRKLEATIAATGGAAGLSAEEISGLFDNDDNAAELRDAAVQLLTFKSVGKDVFETTLRLADDLADAGFGNLSSNAVQLGKALEDPVKGLSALSKSGVTFTDSQKELIAQLVQTGDSAKAQGIILDAVAGQVGGVADAVGSGLTGANEQVDASLRQLREGLGAFFVPALTVASTFIGKVVGKLAEFVKQANSVEGSGKKIGAISDFLAKSTGLAALTVGRLARGVGALSDKLTALAKLDFDGISAIEEAFNRRRSTNPSTGL